MTNKDPREKMLDDLETRIKWAMDQCPEHTVAIVVSDSASDEKGGTTGVKMIYSLQSDTIQASDMLSMFTSMGHMLRLHVDKHAEITGDDPDSVWQIVLKAIDVLRMRQVGLNPDETPGG